MDIVSLKISNGFQNDFKIRSRFLAIQTRGQRIYPIQTQGQRIHPIQTQGQRIHPIQTQGQWIHPIQTQGQRIHHIQTQGQFLIQTRGARDQIRKFEICLSLGNRQTQYMR